MEKADYIKYTKEAAGFIASLGAAKLVAAVIENNVTREGRIDRVLIYIGAFVIKLIIRDIVRKRTDKSIDGAVAFWEKILAEASPVKGI